METGFFTDNSIFIHPNHEILIAPEFVVPTFFKLLPFLLNISFSVLVIVLFIEWFLGFTDIEVWSRPDKSFIFGNQNRLVKGVGYPWCSPLKNNSTLLTGMKCIAYSTNVSVKKDENLKTQLNPWFITGLIDGEGNFFLGVLKDNKYKTEWRVLPVFQIHMSGVDKELLYKVQTYFGVGKIRINKNTGSVIYSVSSVKDLISVIIPHFIKYPLRSAKNVDFKLWQQCIELIFNKRHLTKDGLNQIINLKSALNLGLSDDLKIGFPNIQPMKKPEYIISSDSLDPNWVSGFMASESCFSVSIKKPATVALRFILGLNVRELSLITKIQKYFGAGQITNNYKQNAVFWTITSINNLVEKVLPHFEQYSLQGQKANDYLIWSKILTMVKAKQHFTKEGLAHIQLLKDKLNKSSIDDKLK